MRRAYSLLTVKSFDDHEYTITGIATTPTPDRIGDVVEPKGAQFKLPIPLLWQHRSGEPVGEVTHANVTDAGIEVRAKFAKPSDFTGKLAERLDEAWQSVKGGLVKGLSIGFKSLDDEPLDPKDKSFWGPLRFTKWEWLELSAVTIPANADASIQTVRSCYAKALTASGHKRERVVHLAASGRSTSKEKPDVKPITEQIKAFEATRQAKNARMEELLSSAAEEGRTLETDESEEYDNLESEVKAIDQHLVRLGKANELAQATAKPVDKDAGTDPEAASRSRAGGGVPTVSVKDNLPPGIEFARYAMCIAAARGSMWEALEIAKARYPDNPRIANVLKAAVAGASTTHTTWAGPLVNYDYQFAGDFVQFLRPRTILGRFGTNGIPSLRRVPFMVSVPGQSTAASGYWVGEGAAKPVTKFATTRTQIPFAKVANIAVLTEELVRFSSPSAEMLVRDELARALIERLDTDFVDPTKAAVAGISPASVINGATPVVATGYTLAALNKDLITLQQKFTANKMYLQNAVYIMGTQVAMNIAAMMNPLGQPAFPTMSMQGGTLNGIPVIVSDYVPTVAQGSPTIQRPIIILVEASEIWLADDGGVSVDISREASLQMDNAPTNTPTGLGASPNAPTATTLVSMWQTNSVAIRAEREINWQLRRTGAGQYLTNASYSA